MLVVISPAKKLDFESPQQSSLPYTRPAMLPAAEELIDVARDLSHKQITKMMNISDKLVTLNQQRYRDFSTPFNKKNAKQAVLSFIGETYLGLDARSFSEEEHTQAQRYLRILSGLYGLLRPLDLIQPYRLEMSIKLKNPKGKNLYDFWGEQITDGLNKAIAKSGSNFLLNCASIDYFKAVDADLIKAEIITPVFKQVKNGQARMIGMMAKRGRGAMARFVIQNNIHSPEDLKDFSTQGYRFQSKASNGRIFEFHRQA